MAGNGRFSNPGKHEAAFETRIDVALRSTSRLHEGRHKGLALRILTTISAFALTAGEHFRM